MIFAIIIMILAYIAGIYIGLSMFYHKYGPQLKKQQRKRHQKQFHTKSYSKES